MKSVFSWIYVLIIAAIAILGFSEVMVTYQKYQMKKQFLKELDEQEKHDRPSAD